MTLLASWFSLPWLLCGVPCESYHALSMPARPVMPPASSDILSWLNALAVRFLRRELLSAFALIEQSMLHMIIWLHCNTSKYCLFAALHAQPGNVTPFTAGSLVYRCAYARGGLTQPGTAMQAGLHPT